MNGDRCQEGAEIEADQEPAEGQDLHHGPQPETLDGGQGDDHDHHQIDHGSSPPPPAGQESGTDGGKKDRHHRSNVDGRAGSRASSPLATWVAWQDLWWIRSTRRSGPDGGRREPK